MKLFCKRKDVKLELVIDYGFSAVMNIMANAKGGGDASSIPGSEISLEEKT